MIRLRKKLAAMEVADDVIKRLTIFWSKIFCAMNEAIVSLPTPLKTLSVTEAPCRELCNFLIYLNNPEILNERARRQPTLSFDNLPRTVRETGEILGAEKCEKNRKLYFDCTKAENHRSVLIHNFNAQFWVHYFRCGIGLVSVSYFSELASAEGSVLPKMSRIVADSYEFQWFTHNLAEKYFQKEKPKIYVKKLTKYFIKQVNPNLISPYSICSEERQVNGSYKFVRGSYANLKDILKQAFFVCEGIKREKEEGGKTWISPHLTITCGNLKRIPAIEHSTEVFLNQVGALAIRENTPYTVMNERYFRRLENSASDWVRKNKYHIYLNLQDEVKATTPRTKILARLQLVSWLKRQGKKGEWIIKTWKLEAKNDRDFKCKSLASIM